MIQKILIVLSFVCSCQAIAQEVCLLGVGGNDDNTIIEVFQLTEDQIDHMRNLGAELRYRNELLKNEAEVLLKKHSQSSPEDLLSMSIEYRTLVDSMKSNIRLIDKRLLLLFNDQQYNLYIQLCNTATLSPIFANRQINEK